MIYESNGGKPNQSQYKTAKIANFVLKDSRQATTATVSKSGNTLAKMFHSLI